MIRNKTFYILFFPIFLFFSACGSAPSQTTPTHRLTLKVSATSGSASQSLPSLDTASNPSPSSVSVKFYDTFLSKDPTCSNPIKISSDPNGTVVDISTNPTVFEVDAPEGDYPCIILEFAREITFASPVTEGLCTAGEEYTIDTCNHSQTAEDPTTGTIWNCSDTSITKMFIYISTGSNNPGTQQDDSTDVFLPPTFEGDPLHGVNLNGSININQDITGTFIIDFSHRLNTNNPERCDVSAPAFSFVK